MSLDTEYGLSSLGFSRKTYVDLRKEIENSLSRGLGKLDFTDNTLLGQIVSIFSEREALLWEKLAEVYHSQYPSTAEGFSLDGVCALTGIKRLSATYSNVLCQLKAVNYTNIPKGSEVIVENTGSVFSLLETITITNEKCHSISLRVNTASQLLKIVVNNCTIEYQSLEGQTNEDISEQFIKKINAADINVKAEFIEDDIVITSNETTKSFSCFASDGITIVSCVNNAFFKAKDKGSITAPSHAVNIVQTPVWGWIGVDNINAAVKGRNLESDYELKMRRKLSLKLSGSGTIESIKARLMALKGVTAVAVTENNTDREDLEGRPPQSFEALVVGGEDLSIAKVIWLAKPAGIQTWGNSTEIIKDSNGRKQAVRFSRPIKKYIYARVELKVADNFIDSSIDQIRQNIVDRISSKGINESLIYQSLLASVYSVVGIINADIKIGATLIEEQVPELGTENIDARAAEIIMTDLSKIVVEVI